MEQHNQESSGISKIQLFEVIFQYPTYQHFLYGNHEKNFFHSLQEGIPQKKHRRNLKTYEKCFTGIEATDWLHKHLKKNPNFDAEVSKEQVKSKNYIVFKALCIYLGKGTKH